MPVRHLILPEHHVLLYVCAGHVTGRELFAAERAAWHEPERRMGARILVDLLLVRELDIELRDWKSLVSLNRQLLSEGHAPEPTAVVARGAHDVTFVGALKLFVEALVPLRLHVSDTRTEALEWLGVSDAAADVERHIHALRVELSRASSPRSR